MMVITNNASVLIREIARTRKTLDLDFASKAHLSAAIQWICQAHREAGTGGVSKGYDLLRGSWSAAYPETTGYTVPTLLNAAEALDRPDLTELAISLADFLLENVTEAGAVVHWQDQAKSAPIVFDTGQVIFGWLAAYECTGESRYLQAASRAGDWLAGIQGPGGYWENGQYLGVVKVIDTRVAWALVELFKHTNDARHRNSAVRNLDWALTQQSENGWFRHCAFLPEADPITHTLAYTAEGLVESGILLAEEKYIRSGKRLADALLGRQRSDGSLASTFQQDWRETSRSSCLTGNCQMGSLWLRCYQITGGEVYRTAAQKAIAFVAGRQAVDSPHPGIQGAIAGSAPIFGHYERFKYPNWAAKFFIDALLLRDHLIWQQNKPKYRG